MSRDCGRRRVRGTSGSLRVSEVCSYVNVGYDFEAFKANVLKALEGDCPFESSSGDGKLVCKSIALTGDEDACPHRKCFFFALGCVFMGSKEEVFEHVLNKCPVFLLGGTIADLQDQVTSRDSHIHKLTRTISNLERQLSRLSIQQQHESERSDASSIDSPTELPKVQLQTAASHESLGLGVPPHLPTSISKESLCDLTAGYGSVSYKHSSALNPNSNLLLSPTRQRSFLKKTLTFLSRKKSTDILSSSSDNSSSLNIATMGNGEGPLRSPSKRSSTMRHDHLLPTTKKRRVTPPTLMFSASHSNLKDKATTISASSASASTRIAPTGTTRRRKGLEDIFPGTVIPSSSRSQSPPPPRTRSPMPRAQSPLPRAQSPVPRRAQSPRPHDPTLIPDMEPIEEQGQELSISSQPVFLVSPNATISRSTFLPPLSPIASDSGSSFRSVSSSTAVSFETEHGNRHGTPATSHHSSSQHSSPYLDDEDASVTARGSSSSFETAVSSQTILAVGVKSKAMRRFPSLNGEEEQEVVGLQL
ncbi:hypothetical protein BT69DRAFT_587068 [Atractiella rhizophila]|nr:hypothetical protein BT69DRAFT_587068 [Atractiella rhizophila]